MTTTPSNILVSGGGLGGLSCAVALAERGFEVTVLERAAEFTEIGYGIQLGPNATRILKRFGLWETVAPTAYGLVTDAVKHFTIAGAEAVICTGACNDTAS